MINLNYCNEVENENKEVLEKLINKHKHDNFSDIVTIFNNEIVKLGCKITSMSYDQGTKLDMKVTKN